MKQEERFNSDSEDNNVKDEPTIENDYTDRPEIQTPNPSTATPPIPQEIPVR